MIILISTLNINIDNNTISMIEILVLGWNIISTIETLLILKNNIISIIIIVMIIISSSSSNNMIEPLLVWLK